MVGGVLWLHSVSAHADGPLGPNGSAIETSSYSIDLQHGAVLAGTRVAGLAGSYVAIAEDVDGNLQNPATPANRPFYSTSFFDWWIGLGATFPSTVTNTDFFNSGSNTRLRNQVDGLVFLTPALNLQWGPWGLGTSLELSTFQISEANDAGAQQLDAFFNVAHVQVARAFSDGELVIGVGNRFLTMSLDATEQNRSLFTSTGVGLEAGLLVRPTGKPFRFGAAFRSGIETKPEIS